MSAPGPQRASGGGQTTWETPPALFDQLDYEFRFTLDAAASESNRKCERYITKEEDALRADISQEIVWCNPPYGRGLKKWCTAFAAWSIKGSTVVALLPDATDTEWFARVWFWAHEIRLLTGRVNFVGSRGGNTSGSIIAIYRPQPLVFLPARPGDPEVIVRNVVPPRVSLWDWRATSHHVRNPVINTRIMRQRRTEP